jgi:hypothetical protein
MYTEYWQPWMLLNSTNSKSCLDGFAIDACNLSLEDFYNVSHYFCCCQSRYCWLLGDIRVPDRPHRPVLLAPARAGHRKEEGEGGRLISAVGDWCWWGKITISGVI